MTTIVSRLYADARAANAAAGALKAAGMPASAVDVITRGGDTAAALKAARVGKASAAAYAPRIEAGNALVVARAPLQPFGLARRVMDTLDRFESIHVPGAVPDDYVRETIGSRYALSVLTSHPRIFSQDFTPGSLISRGPVTALFGLPMLKAHRTRRSAMTGTRFMSRAFWPMPLISRRPRRIHAGAWKISEALGIPTLSRRNGPL
ncbi:MAG: hypothetical protein N2422_10460 [Rhodobacteraceae bacterium]|nr:hypothetical protein [Paracoccaceae bacterium]